MQALWRLATAGMLLLACQQAHALDWMSNEVQYLYGAEFIEPYNPDNVGKHTLTFQHFSGYGLGRNFLFVDLLQSDAKDEHATEAYAEGYTSLSLSKLSQRDWAFGPIKDINLTAGINYGHKSYPDYGVNPRVLLFGVTIDFKLPAFDFFNVDILAYIDRGRFDGRDNGCNAETYQIAPVWRLPFSIRQAKFSFEGYANITGAYGNCHRNVLMQPQLRWDVGHHFNQPNKWMLGVEYHYWHNKFGIEGLRESLPQMLGVWKF